MWKCIRVALLVWIYIQVCVGQVIHTAATLDVDNVFTGANQFTQSLSLVESICLSGAAGKVILCSDSSSHRLKFNSNATGSVFAVGIATAGTAGNCVQLASNGIDAQDAGSPCGSGGGGGIGGGGTLNTVPLWTPNGTTLGNSLIIQTIPGNASIQITKPDSTHLGNLSLAGGTIQTNTIFTNTATCSTACFGLDMTPQYRETVAAGSGFFGIRTQAIYSPANTSGTLTTSTIAGIEILFTPAGSTSGGVSNITNAYGIFDSVSNTSPGGAGTITNQYGIRVETFADSVGTVDVTTNKGVDILTGQASSAGHITNDYGLYVEPMVQGNNNRVGTHWGIYVADQGQGNPSNNTWYGVFIAPQSLGFGFNKPTPAIGLGGVNVYTGAGVPSLNCGTTPSLYLNNTAASVATIEYGCISGTTWTAISGGGGAVSSVFGRTGAVVAVSGDYTAALVTNAVSTAAANTGGASMTLNMAASTSASAFRVPNIAAATTTTAGSIAYDTTNKNFHAGANGVDNLVGIFPTAVSPANNDCVKFSVISGVVTLNTAGAACGGSGIGGSGLATFIPVFTGPTTLSNSLLVDDGTTLSYSGTGGISLASSNAGFTGLGQGVAQPIAPNSVGLTAPVSVTGYNLIFPAAAGNGYQKWTNSTNLVTGAFHAVVDPIGTNLDLTAQSGSLGAQTLVASAPIAGRYTIDYYVSESAGCATPGPGVVTATFSWTDATTGRTLVSSNLAFTASPGAGDTIRGSVPLWAASGSAITAITTYTACTTGTATYDIHAWVTEAQ